MLFAALTVLMVGTLAAGGQAQAQACDAGSVTFAAVAESKTLNVSTCDERIDAFSTWGGFFETSSGDAYSFFGLGVDDFGAAANETFSTANATYRFNGDLSTDIFTITLVSQSNTSVGSDLITLYMCPGPEADLMCLTTQTTTISVTLPVVVPLDITTTTLGSAQAGVVYNASVLAIGGTAPRTFATTAGALPAGLSLGTNGVIAGTPTAVGTFNFTVTVTDNASATDSQALSLVVAAPTLAISTATLSNGTAGAAYSQTLIGTGGTVPRAFAVTTGTLPAGLNLSSAGVLSGTPTARGDFDITVTMTDATTGTEAPFTATKAYTLTIAVPAINVTPVTLQNPIVGAAYSATLTASGGVGPYRFTGSMPAGLTLTTGGQISGTPTNGGASSFTVTATDSTTGTGPVTGSRTYTVTVAAPTVVLNTTPLTGGSVGAAYSRSITATGGTAPYTYAVTSGALPSGMALSTAGVISGTPAASGTFSVGITATDASTGAGPYVGSHTYSLVIAPPTLSVGGFPGGASLYAPYSASVSASGGTGPYTYAVTSGSTPSGISLNTDGTFSGTPAAMGSFTFTVTATDSTAAGVGGPYTGGNSFTIVVAAPTISLPASSLTDAFTNQAYNRQLPLASGGQGAYTYTVISGSLPPGMNLSATGLLSGTPSLTGDYAFVVAATDASAFPGPYSGGQTYTLRVVDETIVAIPTLSEWAMILLAALLGAGAVSTLNRRRTHG